MIRYVAMAGTLELNIKLPLSIDNDDTSMMTKLNTKTATASRAGMKNHN